MKMNRRNALLGLGTIATGGGALFGSGAFSTVEADRTATVTIADETSGANLVMNANSSANIANNSGTANQIVIDASKINTDAVTVYKTEIDITNNAGDSNARYIGISGGNFSNVGQVTFYAYGSENGDISTDQDLSAGAIPVNDGATMYVGIEVDSDNVAAQSESVTFTVEAAVNAADTTMGDSGIGPITSTN